MPAMGVSAGSGSGAGTVPVPSGSRSYVAIASRSASVKYDVPCATTSAMLPPNASPFGSSPD